MRGAKCANSMWNALRSAPAAIAMMQADIEVWSNAIAAPPDCTRVTARPAKPRHVYGPCGHRGRPAADQGHEYAQYRDGDRLGSLPVS